MLFDWIEFSEYEWIVMTSVWNSKCYSWGADQPESGEGAALSQLHTPSISEGDGDWVWGTWAGWYIGNKSHCWQHCLKDLLPHIRHELVDDIFDMRDQVEGHGLDLNSALLKHNGASRS